MIKYVKKLLYYIYSQYATLLWIDNYITQILCVMISLYIDNINN